MVYLCIFGEYNKDTAIYLENSGFVENKPAVTNEISEDRANLISKEAYKKLEAEGKVIVSFKLKDNTMYSILQPYGCGKYFTYCDMIVYNYLKKQFGDQVIAVLEEGDIEMYSNQLETFSNGEYKKVADVVVQAGSQVKSRIAKIENYLRRKANEDLFKMHDNNK